MKPFLALRNYNDLDGQWGSEPNPAAFLDNLLTLATELRRVLTPYGSLVFELGDTFSGSGGAGGDYSGGGMRDDQPKFSGSAKSARVHDPENVSPSSNMHSRVQGGGMGWPLSKSLTGAPTLFAWSLAYGRNLLNPEHTFEPWRIRNIIVWARRNPPVGALGDKVRPATSYITVACPSDKRWFDLDAVRTEPIVNLPPAKGNNIKGSDEHSFRFSQRINSAPGGAPPTDHWTDEYDGDTTWLINTHGSNLAHYAMWPAKLAERLILSMCPAEVCRECEEPRRRIYDVHYSETPNRAIRTDEARRYGSLDGKRHNDHRAITHETLGWSDCGHDCYRCGRILDPFAGAGTSLAVADIHGRDATGIDLDPVNQSLYERRYGEVKRALFRVRPEVVGQEQLELL